MADARKGWLAGAALAVGLGCGPEVLADADAPTELGELCGATTPVQLLSVRDDEFPASYTRRIRQRGDRLVFAYETRSYPGHSSQAITTTVYSTGSCGEDPRAIGEGIDVLYDRPDDATDLLGCRSSSGDVLALDVEGLEPARVLLPAVGCVTYPYEDGILGIQRAPGEAFGSLVFRPSLADPTSEPRIVLEGVVAPELTPDLPRLSFGAAGSTILVVTRAGELVSVDPHTGEPTVLRVGARSFVASADLRWVLWQEGLPDTEPPEPGTIRLLDRESGEDVLEDVGLVGDNDARMTGDMVRIRRDDGSTRLVMLPSLQQLDVGREWVVFDRHPSGVVLMEPSDSHARFGLDPETGEVWPLLGGHVYDVEYVGDETLVMNEKHTDYDFSYWRTSIRGGEPERLASHVLAPVWLSNGRMADVRVDDFSTHGQLRVFDDPESDESTLLDDGVFWRILGPRAVREHPWIYDGDVIVWSVHDGDRSGLWAARIE